MDALRVQGWGYHSLFCRRLRSHLSRGPESPYLLCSQLLPYMMLYLVWTEVPVSHQSTRVSLSYSYPSLEDKKLLLSLIFRREVSLRNAVTIETRLRSRVISPLLRSCHTRTSNTPNIETLRRFRNVVFMNITSLILSRDNKISSLQKFYCHFLIRTHRRQCSFLQVIAGSFVSK